LEIQNINERSTLRKKSDGIIHFYPTKFLVSAGTCSQIFWTPTYRNLNPVEEENSLLPCSSANLFERGREGEGGGLASITL
jgi:hypothetical protein